MGGVAEEAAEFRRDDAFAGARRFRRLADTGPVYEVVAVHGSKVTAQMIDSDETFELPLTDAQADAQA